MDEPVKKERVRLGAEASVRERVVELLEAMADAKRRRGDHHRAGAYARAAESVASCSDFESVYARRRLRALAGVGPSIEAAIVAFVEKGERPVWSGGAAGTGPGEVEGADEYARAPFADAPDLHVHTTWSDGRLSIAGVVDVARALGAPAVAITDHSVSLRIARGLDAIRVRAQWQEMAAVQAQNPDIRILRGTECDILRDGRLDHPPQLLAEFDIVVASLHSSLRLDEAAQTARVLAALDDPHIMVLGHPTTRIPGRRPPAKLDLPRIFAKAAERGVAMEVNGNVGRIDLDVPLAREALAAGCKLACASDAHNAREMRGFATARRMAEEAGATRRDIVNYDVLAAAAAAGAAERLTPR